MDNRSFTFCTLIIMKILLRSQRIFGTIEKCVGHVKETKIINLFLDVHQRIWLLFVQIVLSNMQSNKVNVLVLDTFVRFSILNVLLINFASCIQGCQKVL